jgi:hypothetical protein
MILCCHLINLFYTKAITKETYPNWKEIQYKYLYKKRKLCNKATDLMIKWENKVGKDSKHSLQNTLAFNGGVKLLLALAFASNVGGNLKQVSIRVHL